MHLLAILCSLTLALPQGWCCTFVPEKQAKCCACCRDEAPAEAPKPVAQCPCAERATTLTPATDSAPDYALSVVPVLLETALPTPGIMVAVVPPLRPPIPRLHVVHCVWLC